MPPTRVGIHTLDDLLARRFTTGVEIGLDTIQRVIQAERAMHERLTTEMVSIFADITTDRRRRYGVGNTIRGVRADEFTRAHTQKAITGSEMDFPLDGYQYALGYTAAFLRERTGADIAIAEQSVQAGHQLDIRAALQRAIYGASNYTTRDYRFADNLTLNVKRFVNADGADIPNGPNGESFDGSTHTHYLADATFDDVSAAALVNTVLEHHPGGTIRVFIALADESAWRGLTNFKPLTDVRLTLAADTSTPIQRLDPFNPSDRLIGYYGAAEVWVKPWALASYPVAMSFAPGVPKPLVCRVRAGNTIRLQNVATNVLFPIQADYSESEFGFGVWTRTNGAVLYTGGGTYTDPTIT